MTLNKTKFIASGSQLTKYPMLRRIIVVCWARRSADKYGFSSCFKRERKAIYLECEITSSVSRPRTGLNPFSVMSEVDTLCFLYGMGG